MSEAVSRYAVYPWFLSETCILFLLIVNLFTTNIVKEFSNKTHKNLEDFVFSYCVEY